MDSLLLQRRTSCTSEGIVGPSGSLKQGCPFLSTFGETPSPISKTLQIFQQIRHFFDARLEFWHWWGVTAGDLVN
jgi:hypothetical protein